MFYVCYKDTNFACLFLLKGRSTEFWPLNVANEGLYWVNISNISNTLYSRPSEVNISKKLLLLMNYPKSLLDIAFIILQQRWIVIEQAYSKIKRRLNSVVRESKHSDVFTCYVFSPLFLHEVIRYICFKITIPHWACLQSSLNQTLMQPHEFFIFAWKSYSFDLSKMFKWVKWLLGKKIM